MTLTFTGLKFVHSSFFKTARQTPDHSDSILWIRESSYPDTHRKTQLKKCPSTDRKAQLSNTVKELHRPMRSSKKSSSHDPSQLVTQARRQGGVECVGILARLCIKSLAVIESLAITTHDVRPQCHIVRVALRIGCLDICLPSCSEQLHELTFHDFSLGKRLAGCTESVVSFPSKLASSCSDFCLSEDGRHQRPF